MKDLKNYSCEGQLSIFDIMLQDEQKPSIQYPIGSKVWQVMCSDIVIGTVERTWICSKEDGTIYRGYSAREDGKGCYITFWDGIGNNARGHICTCYQDAVLLAQEWRRENKENIILSETFYTKKIKEEEYWKSVRENGHENIEFYQMYEDGSCYFDYGCKFAHYCTEQKNINKELKEFRSHVEQEKERSDKFKQFVFEKVYPQTVNIKNMYKVLRPENTWDYADVRYAYDIW